jgi:division protein CdvB (Snf7/Vps24/ESCRT-III family)
MVRNFFRSNPPLNDTIHQTIGKLKFQRVKLEQATIRLRQRDKTLFTKCVTAVREKQKERAIIFANELSEVRKVLNMLIQTQLAMERIILRLETIKELSDVMSDLLPALRNLRSVTESLAKVMPKMAWELEKVNDSISETLAMAKIKTPQPITPFETKTPAGEEILNEVSKLLEEKLTETLPEPPASIISTEKVESREKVRQMVALTASCQEIHKPTEHQTQEYFSYKDVELQKVSLTIKQSTSLENTLPEHAKKSKGEIDVPQYANELNVPSDDVMETLDELGQKRKIKILRCQQ